MGYQKEDEEEWRRRMGKKKEREEERRYARGVKRHILPHLTTNPLAVFILPSSFVAVTTIRKGTLFLSLLYDSV